MPEDIAFLIKQIRQSECVFIRNGLNHSANQAADHLILKYNNGKQFAKTANDFINNLASKSSWTGMSYLIKCDNNKEVSSKKWLHNQLKHYNKLLEQAK